jgi:hypothetical protein
MQSVVRCPESRCGSLAESFHISRVRGQIPRTFRAAHQVAGEFQGAHRSLDLEGSFPFKRCSNATRTNSDLLSFLSLAARFSFTCSPAGSFSEIVFISHLHDNTDSPIIVNTVGRPQQVSPVSDRMFDETAASIPLSLPDKPNLDWLRKNLLPS